MFSYIKTDKVKPDKILPQRTLFPLAADRNIFLYFNHDPRLSAHCAETQQSRNTAGMAKDVGKGGGYGGVWPGGGAGSEGSKISSRQNGWQGVYYAKASFKGIILFGL